MHGMAWNEPDEARNEKASKKGELGGSFRCPAHCQFEPAKRGMYATACIASPQHCDGDVDSTSVRLRARRGPGRAYVCCM
jgi:hypothetical protein